MRGDIPNNVRRWILLTVNLFIDVVDEFLKGQSVDPKLAINTWYSWNSKPSELALTVSQGY